MAVTTFVTSLVDKKKEAGDATRFYFKRPKDFTYNAGQYIKMYLDITDPDARGVTRYFTLSSSPTEDKLLVTTRIIKSSFKKTLGSLATRAKVKMRGPWGDFYLKKTEKRPLVFLSGGIGITPFRSIVKYVADEKLDTQITMFSSYKTPDEIFFEKELMEISSIHKNIRIINTITQPEGTHSTSFDSAQDKRSGQAEWKGETGRITFEMLKKHLVNVQDNVYYIAGPDPLVDAMHKMLRDHKISEDQILTDGFPGY